MVYCGANNAERLFLRCEWDLYLLLSSLPFLNVLHPWYQNQKNSLLCFIFSAAQLFFMITENSSNYNLIFVFNSPLPPDELFSIINEACGEDKSSVSLTQVML